MAKQITRKDFAFDQCCPKCSQPLTSGTGFFVWDQEEQTEHPYGRDCAEKVTGHESKGIPDLTKMTILATPASQKKGRSEIGSKRSDEEREISNTKLALEYLLLRTLMLSDFDEVYCDELVVYYEKYIRGLLLKDDIKFLIEHEEKAREKGRKFSARNLQCVYAFNCCLRKAQQIALSSKQTRRAEFLGSLLAFLQRNLYLSHNQVFSVNKIFSEKGKIPPLTGNPFVWAWGKSKKK